MSVVPLTLTLSLCLSLTFVLFFLREFTRRRFSGDARESLLPLADETPRLKTASASVRDFGKRHACAPGEDACTHNCEACRPQAAAPAIVASLR